MPSADPEPSGQTAARAGADALRRLAGSAPLGMIETDHEGNAVWVNRRWRAITGCELPTPIPVDHLHRLVLESARDRVAAAYATAAIDRGEFSVEAPIRTEQGELRHVRLRGAPLVDETGELGGFVGTVSDVSEHVELVERLQRSEARFRRLVDEAPMGYLVTDAGGRVVEANQAVAELLGRPGHDLQGERPWDLIHPDDRPALLEQLDALRNGHLDRFVSEHRIVLPGGEVRWVSTANALLRPRSEGPFEHLALIQDVHERRELEHRLAHQATHDHLTGLPNRAALLGHLQVALDLSAADGTRVALLFVDLDRFKQVNDAMGHEIGDQLLTHVAERIAAVLRPTDLVARLGGDEFVILCPGVHDEQEAIALAQRVVATVEASPVPLSAGEVTTSASVGVALSGDDAHPEALLRDADAAMYRAKERGRARLEVFDETLRRRAAARSALTEQLTAAIDRGEIAVYYQPTVDLLTGSVVGVEALARWHHPTDGLLAPSAFIAAAEETGLIIGLGLRVLAQACADARRWREHLGPVAPTVHVNLSARQLATPALPSMVRRLLEAEGLPPEHLCLEITESVLMDDAASAVETLRQLKDVGVRLAIDDFGTGYSSLSYLQRFPVDVLKVDRSFVDGLGPDPADSAIVAAVVGLAHALELEALAEGVETPDQRDRLLELGCHVAQGFWFSPAVPAPDVEPLLTTRFPT